jgi:hypothetical protein
MFSLIIGCHLLFSYAKILLSQAADGTACALQPPFPLDLRLTPAKHAPAQHVSLSKTMNKTTRLLAVLNWLLPTFFLSLPACRHSSILNLGPESLDFQGPPLPMALEMDFFASNSLRSGPY